MRRIALLITAATPAALVPPALAETVVDNKRTTPIATSTANNGAANNVRITTNGVIELSSGTAITLDSNNTVDHDGRILINNANGAIGILVQGGRTGTLNVDGAIELVEDLERKDDDKDNDDDGPFAIGSERFGIRVTGGSPFVGNITLEDGAQISIEGNRSAGVSISAPLTGNFDTIGRVFALGNDSTGVSLAGPVTGNVRLGGQIGATGANSSAATITGDVSGRLVVDGSLTTTGYRYSSRPSDTSKLDADDLLQGGSALRIQSNILGGILLDARPADNDSNDDDEDDDGVKDADETTASINAFGAAPAMWIGGDQAVRIGALSSGFGLDIRGGVRSAGVYDGVTGTGLRIGGTAGDVTIDGGMRLSGAVTSSAALANSIALSLDRGAAVSRLVTSGSISAISSSENDSTEARGLSVHSAANLSRLENSGSITAEILGRRGTATAVFDASGTLRTIENTSIISAKVTPKAGETAVGRGIALDLRANTAGVTVRQTANSNDKVTPWLSGDILFGSGAARLELLAGLADGAIEFGTGDDFFRVGQRTIFSGALRNAGGALDVVIDGNVTLTNTESVNLTSLAVGAGGRLAFTLDPVERRNTQLRVSGTASFHNDALIAIRFASKLESAQTFQLIDASQLSFNANEVDLEGGISWLYSARVRSEQGRLFADVTRKSGSQAGVTGERLKAYEAFFAAFDRDAAVRDAVLSRTTREGFLDIYQDFLPDYSGGVFQVLAAGAEATGRTMAESVGAYKSEGLRVWVQQVGYGVQHDAPAFEDYDGSGVGLTGGVETADTPFGAIGVQLSILGADVNHDSDALTDELDSSSTTLGVYWRAELDRFEAAASITGGAVNFESTRSLRDVDTNLTRTATAEWSGVSVSAHLSSGYRLDLGPAYVKPAVALDYFQLNEDERTERGGGDSFNLIVESRTGSQLAATGALNLGWRLDMGHVTWSPELTAGWRQVSGDGANETVARFRSGGQSFTLDAPDLSGGGPVLRAGLHARSRYIDFTLQGGGEQRDDYIAYDARAMLRVKF